MIYFEAFLGILVGMAVFMYGMHIMGDGLEKAAGGKMFRFIGKFTGNRFLSVGTGAVATAAVHSSTAITVMVVGFVNVGMMNLYQSAGVIMGANIGSTVTGLIMAPNSLNMSLYLMLPVVAGVILIMVKRPVCYRIGVILTGLGLLFTGLNMMSESVAGISETAAFKNIFTAINNPLLLILLGALVTAVIQSSTAINGLIIAIVVPFNQAGLNVIDALFIILGTNVGTCITSIVATIGTNINARRTAMIHLLFNLFGTVLFGAIFMIMGSKTAGALLNTLFGTNPKFQLAWFNLFQNIVTTLIMLPFIKPLVKLSALIIKDKGKGTIEKKKRIRILKKAKAGKQ